MLRLIMVLVIIFAVVCAEASPENSSRPEVINIGALLTFNTITGSVAKIAMEAAEEDVNSTPGFLGGRRLALSLQDNNYSGFLDIVSAMKFMATETVAMIGPQSSEMAHVLSHLANELHVPLLSFTALDPTLSPLQYPYFIRTAPSDSFQMAAIADIISYFRWREIIAIFSADDHNRNGVTFLGHELNDRRCKISYKSVLPLDSITTSADVVRELVKISVMEARVIVVHTYPRSGLLVFDVARSLNMTGREFVWIATSWLTTVLDSNHPVAIGGALTLRPRTPESEKKKAFISRWKNLSKGSVGLNAFGLYAYDTVWTIAYALKNFLDNNGVVSFSIVAGLSRFGGGEDFLEYILRSNRIGLSGLIRFDDDRNLLFPAYDVINVGKSGGRLIGYWSNHSGLSVDPPEILYAEPPKRSISSQRLGTVVFPGGMRETPRGWVFSKNGRVLRIGVPYRVGYRDFVSRDVETGRIKGYCIDVFEAAVKLLPYPVPYRFILFGDGVKNPNYSDFVNKIAAKVFDGAVGDIAIVTNRTRVVDFTQPYIESGLVVVAPVRRSNSSAWVFLQPFTPWLWCVTVVSFVFIGAVVWVLEHRFNDDFRGPPKKQLITIFWFSLSTLFFSQRENTVSTLGRLVVIIWLFVVLIINSSYTASLTSILTVQQLSSPIKGIDTLISTTDRIGFQVGSFAENYLTDELNIPRSRLVALGSPEEYAVALEKGTVAAVVDERPYVELFLSGHCEFTIVGQEFTKSGWGFAFPRDYPLTVDMSTAILKLSESGELQRIHDRWVEKRGGCKAADSSAGSEQLHWESFWGLFLVCGIICLVAVSVHFYLIARQFRRRFPEEAYLRSFGGSQSARLRTFLTFVDERAPDSRLKRKRQNSESLSHGGVEEGRRTVPVRRRMLKNHSRPNVDVPN